MRRNRRADGWTVTLHQIEYACRNACCIHHLRQNGGATRTFLGWFQHHRIAAGQSRSDFQCDLVQGPVPGGNHANHADRFIYDEIVADLFGKLEILQRFQRAQEPTETSGRLCSIAQTDRSAHFDGERCRDIGHPLLIFFDDPTEQGEPFLARSLAEAFERRFRCRNSRIDIGLGAQYDFRTRLLGCRIDDLMRRAANGINPLTIDVILFVAIHCHLSISKLF